jgi:dihydrofolate reductase
MTKYKGPIISVIAAIDERRGIGKDNKLLWHIPEDLKRFKEITSGHPIIMGRKTYESIGKPLPERINIIVTRNKRYRAPDCIVAESFSKAIREAQEKDKKEIFIIGGGQIYKQAIKIADKLYLTLVEGKHEADTFFPNYSKFNKLIKRETKKNGNYSYTFLELKRS